MGNWIITIKGIGPKPPVRELAQNVVEHLTEELGQNVTSAEFISDTPEHSLNLLARRDEEVKKQFKTPDPFKATEPVSEPEPEAKHEEPTDDEPEAA